MGILTLEISPAEQLARDLAKCNKVRGNRPIWQIAAINNAKPRVVNVRQVSKLNVFMGC